MPVTNYIWDVENDSYLAETDENGNTTAVYTNEPQQYGRAISQRRDNDTTYYHFDGTGSTRQLTDGTQLVTDTYLFDAFGVTISATGSTNNNFRYVGRFGYYYDPGLGAYYIRLRGYDVLIGRWSSRDSSFVFDGVHLYVYVRNIPVLRIDPTGAFSWTGKDIPDAKLFLKGPCKYYPDGHRLTRSKTTFKEDKDETACVLAKIADPKDGKIALIQKVKVTMKLTMSTKGGKCPMTNSCEKCCQQSLEYQGEFIEWFPFSTDGTHHLDTDHHNNTIDNWYANKLVDECGGVAHNPCCAWKVSYLVEKELTLGLVAKGQKAQTATPLGNEATFKCCGGKESTKTKDGDPPSMPDEVADPPLSYPATPYTIVAKSNHGYELEAGECGDVTGRAFFNNYKSTGSACKKP